MADHVDHSRQRELDEHVATTVLVERIAARAPQMRQWLDRLRLALSSTLPDQALWVGSARADACAKLVRELASMLGLRIFVLEPDPNETTERIEP